MKKRQRQYVNFTKKMIILYCTTYMGFYLHVMTADPVLPPTPPSVKVQTECLQPTAVLGETTTDEATQSAIQTQVTIQTHPDTQTTLQQLEVATPSAELQPEPQQLPDDQLLEAWWSIMEYKNRLDVSITAMEPIECEFEVTTFNGYKATIRQSVPMESETCTFETTLKGRIYNLWARATSLDGRIREFGRK